MLYLYCIPTAQQAHSNCHPKYYVLGSSAACWFWVSCVADTQQLMLKALQLAAAHSTACATLMWHEATVTAQLNQSYDCMLAWNSNVHTCTCSASELHSVNPLGNPSFETVRSSGGVLCRNQRLDAIVLSLAMTGLLPQVVKHCKTSQGQFLSLFAEIGTT